ncbi:MAG: cytochrome c biogenesis protein CcsA [Anaerolineae bacterium]|nr:cytochrome c biogenesis protein CcsA [Anaerolineae bacterium]
MSAELWALLGAGVLWAGALAASLSGRARAWAGWLPAGLAATGSLCSLSGLAARGLAVQYWPITDRFAFAHAFALAAALTALVLDPRGRHRVLGLGLGLALALWAYAQWVLPANVRQASLPVPALRHYWLPLHAGSAAMAYGALALGSLGALLAARGGDRTAETLARRAVRWGYWWLSASILLGAVWARQTWARYWGWDPKETWSLVTWLLYSAWFHTAGLPAWRGRRQRALLALGLAALAFTFWGVDWLTRRVGLSSLHLF